MNHRTCLFSTHQRQVLVYCRYMLLYHYGGVYADMDTECLQPVHSWAPSGCHFTVALENNLHLCQWAFASVAGHGALKSVLDLVIQRMLVREYMNGGNDHFVHHVTGPAVFTEGILRFLQLEDVYGELEVYQATHKHRLRAQGICMMTAEELSQNLVNLYSSQHPDLRSATWHSWTEEHQEWKGNQEHSQTPEPGPLTAPAPMSRRMLQANNSAGIAATSSHVLAGTSQLQMSH